MAVTLATTAAHHEVSNGLVGVRVPVQSPDLGQPLAPIAGLRYRDGTWTATAPSTLHSRSWWDTPPSPAPPCTAMAARIVEQSPAKVVVEVAYTFDRPELWTPEWTAPAGIGYLKTTLTILDGEPSILVEEDSDCDVGYSLNVWPGLQPTQARYRGHQSTSVEAGREPDGQQYRPWNQRNPVDATVDLDYARPKSVSNVSTEVSRPAMAVWNPWVFDSGWYWQLYNHTAPASANLFGIFAGPASRAIGAATSGAGIWHGPGNAAGVTVQLHRTTTDWQLMPRNRFCWGIFLSTKADLLDPYATQPIGKQMHRHGGLALKLAGYEREFTDPASGYGALYMGKAEVQALAQRVHDDTAEYQRLYNAEPSARPLLDLWHTDTPESMQAVIDSILQLAADLKEELTNGEGIYSPRLHYIQGGQEMIRLLPYLDQALASRHTTAVQRVALKKAAHLFGSILWDNDFVPLQQGADGAALFAGNRGTANMPVQHQQYRASYAVLLGTDAAWKARADLIRAETFDVLRGVINDQGAASGSSGYIAASVSPLLTTLLQFQSQGVADPFAEDARFSRFGEFLLSITSPPDPRFGGRRKVVTYGDGDNHGSSLQGVMATALRKANPTLSALLMQAWKEEDSPHASFFGSTLLMIDERLPTAPLTVGRMQGTFGGFGSAQRHRTAAGLESLALVIDGHHYRDHRPPDQGMVALYLLGVPVSLSWGSIYYPHVPGGLWRSAVQPADQMADTWGKADLPYDAGNAWWGSTATPGTFQMGTAIWKRSVKPVEADGFPAIDARDHCTTDYVWTLNLMATGNVTPSSGTALLPPVHPLAPKLGTLAAGTGRWRLKGSFGVDFDLWLFLSKPVEAAWSSWAHQWAPSIEQQQWQWNQGRPFEEAQHTLRLRAPADTQITWAVVPMFADKPRDGTVTETATGVTISYSDGTLPPPPPPPPPRPSYMLDFGSGTSPIETGFTRVPVAVYTAAKKYGWESITGITAVDNGSTNTGQRDFHRGRDHTFRIDLPDGDYDVTAFLVDPRWRKDVTTITANGAAFASGLTPPFGPAVTAKAVAKAVGGVLRLRFKVAATSGYWGLAKLLVSPK